MTRPPESRRDRDEQRNSRIRELRDQREAPMRKRRTFQPLILVAWFAAVIVLVGVLIFVGLLAFSPRLMAWIEEHPGSIDNGIVLNFVQWYQPDALADEPIGGDATRVTVEVVGGSTDSQIAQLLVDRGLVKSELLFLYTVKQAGRAGDLQAGVYDLSPTLRPSEIVAALKQEAGVEVSITLIEGWRLEQMVGYLGTTKLTMNLDEFAALARTPPADLIAKYDFLAGLPPGHSLEGYLYPDTYRVDANATARQVIEKLLDTFGRRLTQEIRDGITAQGLTIDQAVTLASIVEREAVLDTERPTIAGVYLNRINNPKAGTVGLLNADPTLQYGLASAEFGSRPVSDWHDIVWWPQLQTAGTEVVLPDALAGYQSYQVKGLPPTPISAPRIASIAGVAAPDTASGYFYFVAGCPNGVRDGSHYFAKTLPEQNANIAKADAECPAA
ncbi:MAG: endolytic transglycosylase MltG [Candidatus Limnocylindria bacterium]